MPPVRRTALAVEARRRNQEQLAQLGGRVRAARIRRRLTQRALGQRVDLAQATISRAERGRGGGMTVEAWQRIALALGMDLRLELGRDRLAEPADAAHLALQELVMRLGRGWGARVTAEAPSRPADPSRSVDVLLRDDRARRLTLVEAWNTFGDLGAAARATNRKLAEVASLAVVRGGDEAPYAVAGCWVVRATRANRALLARYPEFFGSRFPGSSRAWVGALTRGLELPREAGLVLSDVGATRLFAWRRAGA